MEGGDQHPGAEAAPAKRRRVAAAPPGGAEEQLQHAVSVQSGDDFVADVQWSLNEPSAAAGSEGPSAPPGGGPKPTKAYRNTAYLTSPDARQIRIMCELQEPRRRLSAEGVDNIVMFFGSARLQSPKRHEVAIQIARARAAENPEDAAAQETLARLQFQSLLVPLHTVTMDVAGMLTKWSMERAAKGLPSYTVGTGAGPGMMEAANEGAWRAKGPSVGFGISLPFEDRLNPFVTPSLGFEFHYFFTRKFWMCYKCMGLVVAPGGLGTCDELFELMTLMQTGKIKRRLPIVLIGASYWRSCINWDSFVDYGMISEDDVRLLHFVDTAEDAFAALVAGVEALEASGHHGAHTA